MVLRLTQARGTILLLAILGCSDGSGPGTSSVAGSYSATILVITPAGLHPVDFLAGGSSLTITIGEDSSVTGHLTIPAELTGEEALEADMAGIATIHEKTVTFAQDEDTFIRDLTFTRGAGYLTTNRPLGSGDIYHVRLDRNEP